jgi:hypothetical protein
LHGDKKGEGVMGMQILLVVFSVFMLSLPFTALAASIPVKVFENGANNKPVRVSGVKVEALERLGTKALLSSGESGADGGCVLGKVPLGKEIVVKLTKAGYVTQYDVRSYSEEDVEEGVTLWIGSEINVKGLYENLGTAFDAKKGQVYLEISDELTGEGIEGIQLGASAGKVFDLGQGEYLIANAGGVSVKIGIEKAGYAFDIESATIPLLSGAMTQYYVKVQSGGAIHASAAASGVTSAAITGIIKAVKGGAAISGATVAFVPKSAGGAALYPSVHTNSSGVYFQGGFPIRMKIIVTPSKLGWTFKPASKTVTTKASGAAVKADFKGKQ